MGVTGFQEVFKTPGLDQIYWGKCIGRKEKRVKERVHGDSQKRKN